MERMLLSPPAAMAVFLALVYGLYRLGGVLASVQSEEHPGKRLPYAGGEDIVDHHGDPVDGCPGTIDFDEIPDGGRAERREVGAVERGQNSTERLADDLVQWCSDQFLCVLVADGDPFPAIDGDDAFVDVFDQGLEPLNAGAFLDIQVEQSPGFIDCLTDALLTGFYAYGRDVPFDRTGGYEITTDYQVGAVG